MTAKEAQKMRRLEIENKQLRLMHSKDMDVYREQALELIELRTRLQLVTEAIEFNCSVSVPPLASLQKTPLID